MEKIPVRNIKKFIKDIWNELNKIEESINDKRYSVTRPKKAEDIDLWTLHCIIGKFESQIRVFEKEYRNELSCIKCGKSVLKGEIFELVEHTFNDEEKYCEECFDKLEIDDENFHVAGY